MSKYPDILFHFTEQKENFKSILSSNFKISYAMETIETGDSKFSLYVPMVSFCDLRLSEVKDNMESYGSYGIGLKKQWAKHEGLNPVLYINKNSEIGKSYRNGVANTFIKSKTRELEDFYSLFNVFRFMKNYDGILLRNGQDSIPNHVFANEREWRFVPSPNSQINFFTVVDDFDDNLKTQLNEKASKIKLEFTPDDISYLIVKNESDINEIFSHIDSIKGAYSHDSVKRLKSRILTYNQIVNDF